MAPKISNRAEAISMAVNLEIKGRQFYLQAAEHTENPTGKAVFQKLADEELRHLRAFLAMAQKTSLAPTLPESVAKLALPLFDQQALAAQQRASADELEALRIAMQQEKEALLFFEQAAAAVNEEDVRKIFNHVREQESYHYDLLQAEYDFIVKTGFWLNVPEFRMDGKM
jgi:rubrerythrin